MIHALPFLFALLFFSSTPALAESVKLELSSTSGLVPFSVKVTGPQKLLSEVADCRNRRRQGRGGPGFQVNWGDGDFSPRRLSDSTDCASLLEHEYSSSGVYEISATLSHPGPTDGKIVDWKATAKVTVEDDGKAKQSSIKILTPKGGEKLSYDGSIGLISWELLTNQPVDITAEMVNKNGQIMCSMPRGVTSKSGTNSIYVGCSPEQFPLSAFQNGAFEATVRISGRKDGKLVVQAESKPFTISPVINQNLDVTPIAGNAPLRVLISRKHYRPGCYSYVVHWGDGEIKDQNRRKAKCERTAEAKEEIEHTYVKPGKYEIRFYDVQLNPGDPINMGGYLQKVINVR